MKSVFKSLAFFAAAILALGACKREVMPVEPAETHSISFVASTPQTKTSASIDRELGVVDYSWEDDDVDRITVYEIVGSTYTEASTIVASIEDGSMYILAGFDGAANSSAKYVAILNKGVKTNQEATNVTYDQESDVLISEEVTSSDIEDEILELCFKRETAFALMTAKNLEGVYVLGTSLTADKVIASDYDYVNRVFKETGSKTISIADSGNPISEVSGGMSDIFVATVPVEDVSLTVGVVTADEDGKFQAAYEKSFAEGKSISFTQGNVRAFNIGMNKVENLAIDLSKDETTTASVDSLTWKRTFVSIILNKDKSSTAANNYCPSTQSSTRFYNGQILTIAPKLGLSIKEIVFEATTDNYAIALANSEWANATALVAENVVTVIPDNGADSVSAKIGATTGHTSIKITYGTPEPIQKRSITIDTNIEHGSVSASETSEIVPGKTITLTATPETGYVLNEWNVTNAATEETIDVVNNKFTMPNADVNVSASFKVAAKSGSVTINVDNSGVTSSYANTTFTVDGITFGYNQWMKSTTSIQAKASTSNSLFNSTEFPSPIRTITFVQASGKTVRSINVYGGTSAKPTTQVTSPSAASKMVFDFSGKDYTYFSVTTPSNAVYFDSITIEYEPVASVSSVAISGDATKKVYTAGDKFDTAGLVATATFDDNSTKVVTNGVTWTVTPETLTTGTSSVSVVATYKNVASDAYTVSGLTVNEPVVLSSISVKTAPTKLTYTEGETFDPTGLVMSGLYSDGSSVDYDYTSGNTGFSFNPSLSTPLTTTDSKVTITYQGKSVDQPITVNPIPALTTMDEIFAAATDAGATATDTKVTFNNWMVTGTKNKNAYLTDNNGKGLVIYADGHGFEAGDILSGTVNCKVQLYNGASELTEVTSSTTGLTVTKGGNVTPATIAIKDLGGVNTGAVITFAELTYNGSAFSDGANTISPYGTFITLPTLVSGKKYSVTGVYIQYNATKEIAPRTADDFVEKAAPKYAVNIATGIANGTVTVNYNEATEGQTVTITATPASGYKLKAGSVTVTKASSGTVTVTDNKFTMPAEAVTVSAEFELKAENDPVTVSMTSFNDISGNVGGDTNVSYEAAKGTASTAPAVNSNEVRIYQNGGLLTITAATGYKLQSVTIGSSMATTIDYASAGASATGVPLAANKTITASEINDTKIVFTCKGTDKNSRLYLNSLSVTYVAE